MLIEHKTVWLDKNKLNLLMILTEIVAGWMNVFALK